MTEHESPQILLIEDEKPHAQIVMRAFEDQGKSARIMLVSTLGKAYDFLDTNSPDLVILDWFLPDGEGIEFLTRDNHPKRFPIVVMTSQGNERLAVEAMKAGALDYIVKSADTMNHMPHIVERSLREWRLMDKYDQANNDLKEAYNELQVAYLDTINRLVLAAEYKDEDTADHITRMSRYSALLADKIGLEDTHIYFIRYASPMHDIGKIGIPDRILFKKGKLSREEFEVMKKHTVIGAKILEKPNAKVLKYAHEIAISHHEKWNGKGYPQGLSGNDIPVSGRIVGLVDVFDALTSMRPYKDPYPVDVALDILKKERGEHFDPEIIDAFFENLDGILTIKKEVDSHKRTPTDDFKWSQRDMEDDDES